MERVLNGQIKEIEESFNHSVIINPKFCAILDRALGTQSQDL
jgi:hypothetical protein